MLDNNQINAVRYQLKATNTQASAEEIRNIAEELNTTDAKEIAKVLSAKKETGLSVASSTLAIPEPTKKQKENLVKQEAKNLGITLNPQQIKQIALDIKVSHDNETKTLNNAKELILAFLSYTESQLATKKEEVRTEIANSLSRFNDALAQQNMDTSEFFDSLNQEQKKIQAHNQEQLDNFLASIQEAFSIPQA